MCAGTTATGGWKQYGSDEYGRGSIYYDGSIYSGIYLDVDISGCGFTSAPIISSSLVRSPSDAGDSPIGDSLEARLSPKGGSEPYSITATNFRVYVFGEDPYLHGHATGHWKIGWIASEPIMSSTFCAGTTATSGWKQQNIAKVYIDVDISGCGFTSAPVISSGLAGSLQINSEPGLSHWKSTGGSELYSITATGFRVYVQLPWFTTAMATRLNWKINWIASEPIMSPTFCASATATSGWTQWTSNVLYRDVDISGCGFTSAPIISSSLGGDPASYHWISEGGSYQYWITATSFRVYVYLRITWKPITPSIAEGWNWRINWIAEPNV